MQPSGSTCRLLVPRAAQSPAHRSNAASGGPHRLVTSTLAQTTTARRGTTVFTPRTPRTDWPSGPAGHPSRRPRGSDVSTQRAWRMLTVGPVRAERGWGAKGSAQAVPWGPDLERGACSRTPGAVRNPPSGGGDPGSLNSTALHGAGSGPTARARQVPSPPPGRQSGHSADGHGPTPASWSEAAGGSKGSTEKARLSSLPATNPPDPRLDQHIPPCSD